MYETAEQNDDINWMRITSVYIFCAHSFLFDDVIAQLPFLFFVVSGRWSSLKETNADILIPSEKAFVLPYWVLLYSYYMDVISNYNILNPYNKERAGLQILKDIPSI